MTSAVWEYYEKLSDKKSVAKCLICHKLYSYRTTITNLKKHLIYKHFDVYQNYLNIANECALEDASDNPLSDFEQVKEEHDSSSEQDIHTLDIKTSTPAKRLKQKQNVTVYIACTSDQEKKKIDEKLLEMIIRNYEPFSIVENEAFQGFVKALNPNYELPNRKLISGTLIGEQYIICKTKVMELVQNAKNVCITIDCWDSLVMDSYLTVTAHFLVDFNLKTVMLHCEQFNRSFTDDLTNCLQNIVQEYNISDKITLAVSNNNQEIRYAIEKNQWTFFGCFLHKLNIIMDKALKVVDYILEKVNTVVSYFKRNNTAAEALLKYQTDSEKRLLPLKLIRSVPKRWNTIFYMLERFLKLQGAMEKVIQNLRLDTKIITGEIWKTIKQICMVLQPFEEVTRIMSSSKYLSGSLVVIIVEGLKNTLNVLKTKSIHGVGKTFLETLEDGVKTHFPEKEIKNNMLLAVCTFVDPRFKIHAFRDHTEIEEHVLELIKIKIKSKSQMVTDNIEVRPITPQAIEVSEESEPVSIWGKIYENIVANAPAEDIAIKAKKELEMFLNDRLLHRDSCPLTWWKEHAMVYPNLSEIFNEYWHIVATAVKCETVFTKAGNLLIQKRSSLSRKHTAELVFLNSNIEFCEWE